MFSRNDLSVHVAADGMRNGVVVLSVLWFVAAALQVGPAWADYELYRKKGFVVVKEIVEKKRNEDGTFTVRAKKSRQSPDVVEFDDVVEIKETRPAKGIDPERLVAPTPTPVALHTFTPVQKRKKGEVSKYPVLKKFADRFKYLFIGGMLLVVLLFVWVRSSS